MKPSAQAGYGTAIAIVIAGLFIAGAIFWGSNRSVSPTNAQEIAAPQAPTREPSDGFRLPNESDHVRGNVDAKVSIVEFSDLECPFCARLHPTLTRIVEEDNDVKWIYRHFPLSSIHSKALSAAVASECIAKLGNNDSFWKFADTVFADQGRLGGSFYQEFARTLGIDVSAFNTCTKDKAIANEVQIDLDEVIKLGGRGTPFVAIVTASGELATFSGALPYEQIKSLINQARDN